EEEPGRCKAGNQQRDNGQHTHGTQRHPQPGMTLLRRWLRRHPTRGRPELALLAVRVGLLLAPLLALRVGLLLAPLLTVRVGLLLAPLLTIRVGLLLAPLLTIRSRLLLAPSLTLR